MMTFKLLKSQSFHRSARSVTTVSRWLAGACLGVTALLAGCGGSSNNRVQAFVPDRVVSFGDEQSLINASRQKYSVNGLTDSVIDCAKYPIWNQRLANTLKVPMRECAAAGTTTAKSQTRAAVGARVADVETQLNTYLATDTLGDKDLVTVYVGLYDVLQVYAGAATTSEADMTVALQARGKTLGALINRITTTGAPVLVVTVPSLGFTPFATAENNTTAGRKDLLTRLTSAFNLAMRVEIINDGRLIGLVDANDLMRAMNQLPVIYALTNLVDPACDAAVALPACTEGTLRQVNGAAVAHTTYLWADTTRPGATFHDRLAGIAEARAVNNPF